MAKSSSTSKKLNREKGPIKPGRASAAGSEAERLSNKTKDDKVCNGGSNSDAKPAATTGNASVSTASVSSSAWAPRSDAASASIGSASGVARCQQRRQTKKSSRNKSEFRGEENSAKESNDMEVPQQQQQSLGEKIGATALSGTLELLKLAGGVTLSTTGHILSPSLQVTRNVVLPNLIAAISEYASVVSPQRLKDWFRIVSSSFYHLVAVVVRTQRGKVFRHEIVKVGADLVDIASSDSSRQAFMDGFACWVKLSEALHTPETKAFLEQLGIWGCRVIDAAAEDRNKNLVHNWYDLLWSFIELSADPATTVAMAEVAAYLCHALEMEDAAFHDMLNARQNLGNQQQNGSKSAEKRYERNRYQKSTYLDPILIKDPNATVEEVILSAFGSLEKSLLQTDCDNDIPGSVVLSGDKGGDDAGKAKESAVKPENDDGDRDYEKITSERHALDIPADDIDVAVLRECIRERSSMTRSSFLQRAEKGLAAQGPQLHTPEETLDDDDGTKDIEDLSVRPSSAYEDANPRKRNAGNLKYESTGDYSSVNPTSDAEQDYRLAPTRIQTQEPLEGESPVAHFYRVLDDILASRRKDAMDTMMKDTGVDSSLVADSKGAKGGLKQQLQKIQSQLRAKKDETTKAPPGLLAELDKHVKKNQLMTCGIMLAIVSVAVIWFAFGCYGIYMIAFPSGTPRVKMPTPALFGGALQPSLGQVNKNEIVIRIVREIVHVNEEGETLKNDSSCVVEAPALSKEDIDTIAVQVARSIQNQDR